MGNMNLFWPVYKKIEKEMLELATLLHIDDTQLNVYSIYIGELIVRCVTEIEAISKSLYEILGGNMNPTDDGGNKRSLYFDTDCLNLIENEWKLGVKEIVIENEKIYIEKEKNKKITPLKKANQRSGTSWNRAYQAIKHNRLYDLKRANIKNLLDALGALYILNVYYKDEVKKIGRYVEEVDDSYGSEIFLSHIYQVTRIKLSSQMNDTCIIEYDVQEREKSIGLIRFDDETFSSLHRAYMNDCQKTIERILSRKEVKEFLDKNPEARQYSVEDICQLMDRKSLLDECRSFDEMLRIEQNHEERMELVLNKNTSIYSECMPAEGDNPENIMEIIIG